MAYFTGKTGYLKIKPAAQGGLLTSLPLEEWSLELETEEVEFTNFETYGMKAILGGIRGGTVSGSGVFDSVSSAAILTDFQASSGKIVEVELGLKNDLVTPLGITVYAVLTGLTIGDNVKEKVTFEFTGTLSNMDNATGVPVAVQNQALAVS